MGFFHTHFDTLKCKVVLEMRINAIVLPCGLAGSCAAGVVGAFAGAWVGSAVSVVCNCMLRLMALYFFRYSWHIILQFALAPLAFKFFLTPVVGFLRRMITTIECQEEGSANILTRNRQEESSANILTRERQEEELADMLTRERQEEELADMLTRERQEESSANILTRERQEESSANILTRERQEEELADMLDMLTDRTITQLGGRIILEVLSRVILIFLERFGALCIHGGCVKPIYPRLNLPILKLLYNNKTCY